MARDEFLDSDDLLQSRFISGHAGGPGLEALLRGDVARRTGFAVGTGTRINQPGAFYRGHAIVHKGIKVVTILGTQSPALAGPFFDNPDFILLFPGASQKISYDLPDEFRVGQRIFHTCYVLALPDDFTEPTPLDLTITTEPCIVSGDAAVAVVGIFNTTPTYKLNYVSGGKFTAKSFISAIRPGVVFHVCDQALQ